MRRPSVKVNLRWPRSTATSTINTRFCFPHGVPLLALQRIAIVAPTCRITQIPIAEPAAPSAHFTRGFVPWRLSDDGPAASPTISIGRHPKPSTKCEMLCASRCFPLRLQTQTLLDAIGTSHLYQERKRAVLIRSPRPLGPHPGIVPLPVNFKSDPGRKFFRRPLENKKRFFYFFLAIMRWCSRCRKGSGA